MRWTQRPTLVVGDETLCSILSKRIMDRGAYVYYWTPHESRIDLAYSSRMQVINRELSALTGSERFIRRTSLIFYMLSSEYLQENYSTTLEFIRKLTNSISNRIAKIIVTVPMGEAIINVEEFVEIFSENSHIIGSIVMLPSIYGPGVNRGIIFNTLEKLKRDSCMLRVPASPNSMEEFIYIEDALTAITKLLSKMRRVGVYRLEGDKVRVSRIIRGILAILGLDGFTRVTYTGRIHRKSRRRSEKADELEWFKPSMKIHEGLKRTIDWFEASYGPILVCPRKLD